MFFLEAEKIQISKKLPSRQKLLSIFRFLKNFQNLPPTSHLFLHYDLDWKKGPIVRKQILELKVVEKIIKFFKKVRPVPDFPI